MYQILANYYQELVDSQEGSLFFFDLFKKYHKGKKVLDCACGSGEFVALLHENKYDVHGFDLSVDMIKKCRYQNLVQVDNMTKFKYSHKFNTITCFCDSLNYLLKEEDIFVFFNNVYDHLEEGGVFIFDMHTYSTLEEFKEEYYQEGKIGEMYYQWNIMSQNDLLFHTFIFDQMKEEHIQRVYTYESINHILEKVGFTVERCDDLGGYELEKDVIIAIKEEK